MTKLSTANNTRKFKMRDLLLHLREELGQMTTPLGQISVSFEDGEY
jgi:hypothetical protein